MQEFEPQLAAVRAYLSELRAAGRSVTTHPCTPAGCGLPVRVGPGASAGVILRGDTYVELGNPQAGSCGMVLWTSHPEAIVDGHVSVVGPDLPQSAGLALPFGQVVMVGGRRLTAADYPIVSHAQYVGDSIEGYMVRSSARSVWARVSKDAVAKGFDFACLGRALLGLFKASLPGIEAVEIVFVTSGSDDVKRLATIADEAHQVGLAMLEAHWRAKGYELDCGLDCASCHEKDVCDDIRKVIAAKARKERSVHV